MEEELVKFSRRKFSGNAKHREAFEISNFEGEREKEKGTLFFFERSIIKKQERQKLKTIIWKAPPQVQIQIFFETVMHVSCTWTLKY